METNDAPIVSPAHETSAPDDAPDAPDAPEPPDAIDPNLAEQEERHKSGFPCP